LSGVARLIAQDSCFIGRNALTHKRTERQNQIRRQAVEKGMIVAKMLNIVKVLALCAVVKHYESAVMSEQISVCVLALAVSSAAVFRKPHDD
jgi:hypothetical protein